MACNASDPTRSKAQTVVMLPRTGHPKRVNDRRNSLSIFRIMKTCHFHAEGKDSKKMFALQRILANKLAIHDKTLQITTPLAGVSYPCDMEKRRYFIKPMEQSAT